MGATRRKAGERREPLFDATPTPGLDLRLDPRDRPGGASQDKRVGSDPSKRRSPAARERRMAESERAAPARGREAEERRPTGRTRRAGSGGGSRRSGLGRLIYWTVVLGLWATIAAVGVFVWVAAHLPPIQSLEVPKRPPGIQILAADGKMLATRGEMAGADVPLKELPKYLPQAFLAIEDRRFYEHFGIDLIGVARAVLANLMRRGVSQGGSTLTQQLAKNLFLTQERTLHRKLQEAVLALWLERKLSKPQILELYVNRVYFGAGAYGVEAAAQRYFGKSARQVTLAEAAMLAGLVRSPSRLAPTRNPQGAAKRAEVVLAAMAVRFVTADAVKVALARPVRTIKQPGGASANYVADWVMEVLDDLIGRVEGDVIVETTINPTLQAAAEAALSEELAQKGEKFAVEQGAVIAMTPDGAVRALVGGKSYADSQFNRAVAAKRQPGSAFKPFVYLTALERGLTPESIREDRAIDLKGWRPENYGREYFGPVTLTRALAHSLNTVSVRLTLEVGPKSVVQTAHRLGIASKLEPNASIGLGTSEVTPLELTAAFAPFANGGLAIVPHVVTRVRTAGGRTLYRRTSPYLGRIVDPRHVAMMNTMLQETLQSGTARKAELPNWTAAGKTGTSQDFRDAWFIGYTGYLIAGVWVGNDDSSATRKTTGGGLPVEIWSRVMRAGHADVPPVELPGAAGRTPAAPVPLPPATLAGRPLPPAAIGDPGRPPPADGMTLDRWLIDKVFGRR
jgi:penicillin-binding protein 1A